MKQSLLLAAITMFCFTMSPRAMKIESHCEKEEHITIESDTFTEDYLYLGPELTFSGSAHDLVFLGKQLSFSGRTEQSCIGIGQNIRYSGTSGNDLIAAGGSVVIDGNVDGNSFIAGRTVELTKKALVKGTQFIACGKGAINCPIQGDVYVGAGNLLINDVIDGNIKVYGGRLIFGENGKIHGNLTYGLKEKLSAADSSHVTGTITRDEKFRFDMNAMFPEKSKKAISFFFNIFMAISFIAIGCLLLFFPLFRKLDETLTEKTYWYTALWGLIPVLMYPAVILLSFALIVTIPLGILLILSFVPLCFIAYLIGTTLTGKYMTMRFKWNLVKRHYHFLVGALTILILSLIPLINFITFLFIVSLGWGKLITSLFGKEMISIQQPQPGVAVRFDKQSVE